MMYWCGNGMSGWGFALMALGNIVIWGLLVVGVIYLVRYFGRGSGRADSTVGRRTPEQLLAERYARGDIDEEEYRRRLATLRTNT